MPEQQTQTNYTQQLSPTARLSLDPGLKDRLLDSIRKDPDRFRDGYELHLMGSSSLRRGQHTSDIYRIGENVTICLVRHKRTGVTRAEFYCSPDSALRSVTNFGNILIREGLL